MWGHGLLLKSFQDVVCFILAEYGPVAVLGGPVHVIVLARSKRHVSQGKVYHVSYARYSSVVRTEKLLSYG